MEQLKVGDKVEIPLVKETGISWEKSFVIKSAFARGQNYLVVTAIEHDYAELDVRKDKESITFERFELSTLRKLDYKSPTLEHILVLRQTINEINAQKTL